MFEQCAKRLWLSVHRPELSRESDGTRRVFRVGHEVGAAACALYPDGIEIDGDKGMAHAAEATVAALMLEPRVPLFEATFIHHGVVIRVDLLLPEKDGWHVIEVKSTTRVKPYQRADLATQLWVMRGCGIAISNASIRVINTKFVLREQGQLRGLFVDEQASSDVDRMADGRATIVDAAVTTLEGPKPAIPIGPQCTDPFQCSFDTYCRQHLTTPPEWPVALLPGVGGKALARALAERGQDDLLAVEADAISAPLLQRVYAATVSGVPYHDAEGVRRDTEGWSYPRTFVDFESIAFAVPRWIGTSPYQQVPFQFSAHVDYGSGDLEHAEFLSIDGCDPREGCAEALANLPDTGSVIAWNASFERSCLLQLANVFPECAAALRSLASRLVDLLPVARRHYYHRDIRGSWSIKAVLPTLAPELNYALLAGARSGVEAQDAFLEAIDPNTSHDRRVEIREGLLAYCARDTVAMVVLLTRLSKSG